METGPFEPSIRKDAADFTDANPVEAEHVYLLMAKNVPPDAISGVKRAKWIGDLAPGASANVILSTTGAKGIEETAALASNSLADLRQRFSGID